MHLWKQEPNTAHVFQQRRVKNKTRTDVCYNFRASLKDLIVIKKYFTLCHPINEIIALFRHRPPPGAPLSYRFTLLDTNI